MYHHDPRSRRLAFETMENRLPLDAAACAEPIMDGEDAAADAPVLCVEAEVSSEPESILISEPVPADLEEDAGNVVVEADAALVDAALETVAPELDAALIETAALDLEQNLVREDDVVDRTFLHRRDENMLTIASELLVDPRAPNLTDSPAEPVGAELELELSNPNSPVVHTKDLSVSPPPTAEGGVPAVSLHSAYVRIGDPL